MNGLLIIGEQFSQGGTPTAVSQYAYAFIQCKKLKAQDTTKIIGAESVRCAVVFGATSL